MSEVRPRFPVGQRLRELRESRDITLEDMSRATRIGVSQLEALETGDFGALPASVFVKGFIRSYCEFLGEPSDEPLRHYRELVGEPPAVDHTRPVPRRVGRSASPILISAVLLAVFGGGLAVLTTIVKRERPVVA